VRYTVLQMMQCLSLTVKEIVAVFIADRLGLG